jgi:flagellar biosynthetic protein FlhB
MAESSGEKTHDATPHRRQQAREKGQVAQSQDLGSALMLVAAVLVLMVLGGKLLHFFGELLARQLGGEAWIVADRDFLLVEWKRVLIDMAGAALPIMGLMMLVGVLVNLMQFGFLLVPDRLAPDIGRINPLAGFKRIFSLAGVVKLTFGVVKIGVVGGVALLSLYSKRAEIIALTALDAGPIALYLLEITLWTTLKIGLVLLILAILDYGYQWWKHEQDLKMTQQEIREEMKDQQGDPQMIARRRQIQRQLAMDRIGGAVPTADVVVTNPTELAVAIKYDPDKMIAPVVVAKGAGEVARRIRRLALENDIPIVEKKPLARALYKQVEVDQPVPNEFYAAVAEILAYVYQLKGKEIPRPADAA